MCFWRDFSHHFQLRINLYDLISCLHGHWTPLLALSGLLLQVVLCFLMTFRRHVLCSSWLKIISLLPQNKLPSCCPDCCEQFSLNSQSHMMSVPYFPLSLLMIVPYCLIWIYTVNDKRSEMALFLSGNCSRLPSNYKESKSTKNSWNGKVTHQLTGR